MAERKTAKAAEAVEEVKGWVEEKSVDPFEDKVKIKLFKDNGKYSKAVYAAVNGRSYMIPRGIEVEVPRCVVEALKTSEEQDMATNEMIQELEKQFEQESV